MGILLVGPVGADVASMEEMESNDMLVLGNGCWVAVRSNVLEPIGQGLEMVAYSVGTVFVVIKCWVS
jgi:hypothetical protein